MMGRWLGLVAALLFVPAALAASTPLDATLEWKEATAVGDADLAGGIHTIFVPKSVKLPVPEAALFLLDAQHATLTATYRDYVHTAMGDVDPEPKAKQQQWELDAAKLRLAGARQELQLMAVSKDTSTPQIRLLANGMRVSGEDHISEQFTNDVAVNSKNEFSPSVEREGAAVTLETDALRESVVLEGDFVLHLWDLDVSNEADQVYRSGIFTPEGATPGPADTQDRWQLLTLDVQGGRLTFALPGRPLRVHADPATAVLSSKGSWDIEGANGAVSLAGKNHDVSSEHLRLAGDLTTKFENNKVPILSHWEGLASEASASRTTLTAGVLPTKAGQAFTWWPFVLGIGLLGLGGGSAWAYRSWSRKSERPAVPPADAEIPIPAEDDPLVVEAIAQMEQGQAAEVIEALERGFDASEASAPVKAYLLSLAHLQEGHTEQGITWILKAIEFFPDFVEELKVNEAFAAARRDPRIQRLLNQEGVTGYV